jgi:hypothetical protein
VINKSFREILIEICGTASRAQYWLEVSEACMVLIAALAALIFQNYPVEQQVIGTDLFWILFSDR